MRFVAVLLILPLLGACVPASPVDPPAVVQGGIEDLREARESTPTPAPGSPPVAASPAGSPRVVGRELSGVTFEGVEFDSRSHRLVVADQPGGPGSRFADAGAAGRFHGGIAAINAGFFTPEGAPLGLVISDGKAAGAWNSASSLGNGAWYETPDGRPTISRREALGRVRAAGMRQLIQAGPMLVENGRSVSGLDATKSSVRMVILWDGGTKWWMGQGSPCSLSEFGRALAEGGPAEWKTRHALNLDGGRSADLWVSGVLSGGPMSKRPAWNRPVRNFLVLVPR